MTIIQIEALENGAHLNQSGDIKTIPDGWAKIPENMDTPNFPFGEVTVEEIDGVMTVTSWTALPIPEDEPQPEPETKVTADDILNVILGVNE